jgi:hypothetical protein
MADVVKKPTISSELAQQMVDEEVGKARALGASPPNAAGSLPDLAITETIHEVIVYHSDGLHMGVHDRRTNETESAMLEVPAECIGLR